ncbi:phytochrome-interacting ankyrin-repeat protein 2-like [Humulus lupulus]|uniref:phytochrome-interacting ankyrin-repeat protein 2-like n=1 Tax=Humulus lupulus TaxID=3486 RepID=UPI002B417D66|nr:phytochrome-interacting ankyrin-repeat protein 2-like [Humulus lupulus]
MSSRSLSRTRRRSRSGSVSRDDHNHDHRSGWSSLHIMARRGDLEEVKRLLEEEGMDVNVAACGSKSTGVTPLHLAAEGGHLSVMEELLERGADIDAKAKNVNGGSCGWTPLHYAAKQRKREAVKFLVENGAFLAPDINDCRFNPPIYYCVGLDWAYEEFERLQREKKIISSSSSLSSSPSDEETNYFTSET